MVKKSPLGTDVPSIEMCITTINIDNIKTNVEYLQRLREECPIVGLCVQEHWLYSFEKGMVNTMLS
jgi:hypothetical protein